jgi:hypothetical protein
MSEPEKNQKNQFQSSANLAAAGIAGQIGCVIPVIIIVAVLGGVWLDRVFNTGHVITLLLVLASLPLSIYLTFRMAMRAVKEINQSLQAPASTPSPPSKKDEMSEQ